MSWNSAPDEVMEQYLWQRQAWIRASNALSGRLRLSVDTATMADRRGEKGPAVKYLSLQEVWEKYLSAKVRERIHCLTGDFILPPKYGTKRYGRREENSRVGITYGGG